jgi:hypothetical protein
VIVRPAYPTCSSEQLTVLGEKCFAHSQTEEGSAYDRQRLRNGVLLGARATAWHRHQRFGPSLAMSHLPTNARFPARRMQKCCATCARRGGCASATVCRCPELGGELFVTDCCDAFRVAYE